MTWWDAIVLLALVVGGSVLNVAWVAIARPKRFYHKHEEPRARRKGRRE